MSAAREQAVFYGGLDGCAMNDFVRRWPSSDVLLGAIGYGMAIALFYIVFFGDALVDIAYGSSLSGVPVLAGLSALLICTVLLLLQR